MQNMLFPRRKHADRRCRRRRGAVGGRGRLGTFGARASRACQRRSEAAGDVPETTGATTGKENQWRMEKRTTPSAEKQLTSKRVCNRMNTTTKTRFSLWETKFSL